MTLRDFKTHFTLLVICKLSPGLLSQEVGQTWLYTMLEGRWEKGTTAGGQMRSPRGECVHRSQDLLDLKWQLLQAVVVAVDRAQGAWLRVRRLYWLSCVLWP